MGGRQYEIRGDPKNLKGELRRKVSQGGFEPPSSRNCVSHNVMI